METTPSPTTTETRDISLFFGSFDTESVFKAEITIEYQMDYSNDGDESVSQYVSKIVLVEGDVELPLAIFDEDALQEIADDIANNERERGEEARAERAYENKCDWSNRHAA